MSITHDKVYRESYRVADDSYNRYELYVGEDQMPEFDDSDQPVATAAALPISYTPNAPASGQTTVLYCVTRKRNQYNLLSFNQHPTLVEINELSEEELGPLSTPEILEVIDGVTGQIVVGARYQRDDRNPAEIWEVYVGNGVDPDPDLDTPDVTAPMGKPGVDYMLRTTVGGLTPGSTAHVIVVVRRDTLSTDDVTGESAVTQFTLAVTYDIDAGEASMSGGDESEIS